MDDSIQIILALGSNSQQKLNIDKAKSMLVALLGNICFSKNIWTHPIGICSNDFLNCLAISQTTLSLDALEMELKMIEKSCGDSTLKRKKNVVKMDIDILKYGTIILHEKDWKRSYVKELLQELLEKQKKENMI